MGDEDWENKHQALAVFPTALVHNITCMQGENKRHRGQDMPLAYHECLLTYPRTHHPAFDQNGRQGGSWVGPQGWLTDRCGDNRWWLLRSWSGRAGIFCGDSAGVPMYKAAEYVLDPWAYDTSAQGRGYMQSDVAKWCFGENTRGLSETSIRKRSILYLFLSQVRTVSPDGRPVRSDAVVTVASSLSQ